MRDIAQTIAQIDAIESVNDEQGLDQLGRAMDDFFAHPAAVSHLAVWFRFFERFPEDDGYESFWTILHGIEAYSGHYEDLLIESVRRRPSRFPVMMVARILNADQTHAAGTDLLALLNGVAADTNCLSSAREDARRYVESTRAR
jgi:hypothetical protein